MQEAIYMRSCIVVIEVREMKEASVPCVQGVEFVGAEVITEDGIKYLVANGKRWAIKMGGRKRFFSATIWKKNGDVLFETTKLDIDEAESIANAINSILDDNAAKTRKFYRKAIVRVEMTYENGKFYA